MKSFSNRFHSLSKTRVNIRIQNKIHMATMKFLLNKKLVRNVGMSLLGILVLLGITRACFFSNGQRKSSYYTVARNINWNEFRFSGKEANVQAFAEELVLAASKEANLRLQFIQANPQTLLEDLEAEKYDAVFSFMVPNSLNEEIYVFSDPLYNLGSVLVVKKDSEINNLNDIDGKLVGVSSNSSAIYQVSHFPSILVITYDSMNSALNALASGKIDAVIMDIWNAHVNIHGFFADQLKIATIPFTHEGLRLVASENSQGEEFIKNFNDGLERVKVSGLYKKLIKKWDLYGIKDDG